MATFTDFANILPDPVNKIRDSGDINAAGTAGPGFASVNVKTINNNMFERTLSNRGVATTRSSSYFEIEITYNPMTPEEFWPVSSFLMTRRGMLKPFYVALPQFAEPRDATFATHIGTYTISAVGAHTAGATSMLIDTSHTSLEGTPKPGDMFTIADASDANHKKAYLVTMVETNALYHVDSTQPGVKECIVHFDPPLTRNVSDNSVINFANPLIRVKLKNDEFSYPLNTDNLYQFSLSLEEIEP